MTGRSQSVQNFESDLVDISIGAKLLQIRLFLHLKVFLRPRQWFNVHTTHELSIALSFLCASYPKGLCPERGSGSEVLGIVLVYRAIDRS